MNTNQLFSKASLQYISAVKWLKKNYDRWKDYVRVDVIMYVVMIMLFIIILLFYL